MAPSVLQTEPLVLTAGDTWAWNKTLADYPPSEGWVLGYAIRGASVLPNVSVVVTSLAAGYSITVAPSATTSLAPGAYQWQSFVDGAGAFAGQHFTVDSGVITVVRSMSAVVDNSAQTHAERTLAIIEAKIEGRLTADFESYSINGRSIMKIPLKELIVLRAIYQAKVYRLNNRGQLGPVIVAEMNNPDGVVGTAAPVVLPPWYRAFGQ